MKIAKEYALTCEYCNNTFYSTRKSDKFCSLECTRKDFGRIIKCEECGKEIYYAHKSRKFCSKTCSNNYNSKIIEMQKIETSFRIFARDNFRCIYCGKSSIKDEVKLVVDHIYPAIKGGSGRLFNLITACDKCNGSKHMMMLSNNQIIELWNLAEERNKNTFSSEEYGKLEKYFLYHLELRNKNR